MSYILGYGKVDSQVDPMMDIGFVEFPDESQILPGAFAFALELGNCMNGDPIFH